MGNAESRIRMTIASGKKNNKMKSNRTGSRHRLRLRDKETHTFQWVSKKFLLCTHLVFNERRFPHTDSKRNGSGAERIRRIRSDYATVGWQLKSNTNPTSRHWPVLSQAGLWQNVPAKLFAESLFASDFPLGFSFVARNLLHDVRRHF